MAMFIRSKKRIITLNLWFNKFCFNIGKNLEYPKDAVSLQLESTIKPIDESGKRIKITKDSSQVVYCQ